MEFHLLHIFTFLSLALVASHAALVTEVYWNTVLHNTSMPKAVKDLLKSDGSTLVEVPKGEVNVKGGKQKLGEGSTMNIVYPQSDSPFDYQSYAAEDQSRNVNPQSSSPFSYHYAADDLQKNIYPLSDSPFSYHYAADDLKKNIYPQSDSPFSYHYAAKNPLHNNKPSTTLFFLEKDLHQGTKMNLHFVKSSNDAVFLPRQVADSIPFSSRKMPEIFNRLSVNPSSREAEVMKKTIKQCEQPGIKEEEKTCVTSLESMIDFSTSKLGKYVQAISTEAENATQLQKYSVLGLKKMASEKTIVCHKQNYPYAVFYCHKTYATKVYMVSLAGVDGAKAEALAVCHQDTSAWNPKHLAFVLLKVKPGTLPICHFLPEDHIVWILK